MDFDIPASQKDHRLPMIINLRGDEDLVEEFNWDADQAMDFLGIKRSRLTQISGKELRVARIRRDRYLRPVYREIDVRDYQDWTRATATHQSSSRAIEQAIDSLDDRFSDLFVVLQEKLQAFENRSGQLLRKQLHRLDLSIQRPLQSLGSGGEEQRTLLGRGQDDQKKVLDRQQTHQETLQSLLAEVQDMRGLFGSFHQDLRTLIVTQNQLRKEFSEIQSDTLRTLLAQYQESAGQQENMQNSLQKLESLCEALLESQKQEAEIIPAPVEHKNPRTLIRSLPKKNPLRWQRPQKP